MGATSTLLPRSFTFIDLFAGVGGFHHALASLGGQCVMAIETDEACQRVYRSAFPEFLNDWLISDIRSATTRTDGLEASESDIRNIVPEHDVLCAGFPCQPFSKSGAQRGVRDRTRGTLFFDIMTIIRARRPRFVILENVRNLAGPRHADTWATIVESLREAGYRVADQPLVLSPHLLKTAEGGTPQVRDRVFVLASRVGVGPLDDRVGTLLRERTPSAGWDPDHWDIREWLDSNESIDHLDRYLLRPQEVGWIAAWQEFCTKIPSDMLPGFPIWADEFRVRARIPKDCPPWKRNFLMKNAAFYRAHRDVIDRWRDKRWGPLKERIDEFPASRRKFEWQARKAQPTRKDRDLSDLVLHMRPSGIRVKPASYLPALVAITQTSVLGSKVTGGEWRRLTPREAARLQGIPYEPFEIAEVDDKTIYRQLGNAVNSGVVRHLAQVLFADSDIPFVRLETAG